MSSASRTGQGHEPVMPAEVIRLLSPTVGKKYLDLTLGAGGHTEALLEGVGPSGMVVGVDRDEEALLATSRRLLQKHGNVRFFSADFANLEELQGELQGQKFDGVLMDLGVSSIQLDSTTRGFSFQTEGPLDMRMDRSGGRTAADLVNTADEKELTRILREYGEEHKASRVARAIVEARKRRRIEWTTELSEICKRVVGRGGGKIHPATRTFQALRIAVNDELRALESALGRMPGMLKSGGVVVVISFHSLEDRIVKTSFREGFRQGLYELLTVRPLRAGEEEVERNRRARSARLRAARRTEIPGERIEPGKTGNGSQRGGP